MKKENITIEIFDDGYFNVIQGEKYSEKLNYDELMGLVTCLTLPENRPSLNWMKTKEEHETYYKYLVQIH